MQKLLNEWRAYLQESRKRQEEINVVTDQLEDLLSGYVSEDDIKKVYDFIRYFKVKRRIKSLNSAYKKKEGENIADAINSITGLENYKKAILKMLGAKFESTLLDKISYFFGRDEKVDKVRPIRSSSAYLHWDGSQLHWKVGGQTIRSWNGTSGKLWFFPAGIRDKSKKSFGPIPEGSYSTGGIQTVYRNIEDPNFMKEIVYLASEIMGKSVPHNWSTKKGKNTVFSQIAWGNHRIPIIGSRLGRSGFYIHGGTLRGSSGCIDLGDEMESFAKFWSLNVVFKRINKKKKGPTLVVDYEGRVEPKDTRSDAIARVSRKNLKKGD